MEIRETKIFRPECDVSSEIVSVKVVLDRDLSGLLPYIQGALGRGKYDVKGAYLKFTFQEHPAIVDHDCIAVAGFSDDVEAKGCVAELVETLRDIDGRRDSITPDATPYDPPSAMDVFKLLPKKSGCGKCGYPACMAFAVALTKEETSPEACPVLMEEGASAGAMERLRNMLEG